MDLFDCSRDNDPSQRYVCNIVDLRSRYIVAAAPLDTKSAHGVLWVVSARGGAALRMLRVSLWASQAASACWCNAAAVAAARLRASCHCCPAALPAPPPQLFHTCCREGFPAIIQADNGSEFCAWIIQKFCDLFGIELRHGSVGRPNVQGAVENKNGGLQDGMRSLLLRYPHYT